MTDDARTALSNRLWKVAEEHIEAEWICCEPVLPRHHLCEKGHAALGMARTLLVDSPEAWNPSAPLLDAVITEIRRNSMQAIPVDDFGQPIRQCYNCNDIACFGCMIRPEAEQDMLVFALGLAQEQVYSRGDEFTEDQVRGLENLKRNTDHDRRLRQLESVLIMARNALASLIDYVKDPGADAYSALHVVSEATKGVDPEGMELPDKLLVERDAKLIESVAKMIGDDSWARRDRWGRYEDEEFESGMRKAETLANEMADRLRDARETKSD